MRIIIAGSGPAAVEAALCIREIDNTSEITLISRESVVPYRRPLLTKLLTGKVPDERFFLHDMDFYRNHNISLLLNRTAVEIDHKSNKLLLDDLNVLEYDKLLIATGGRAVKLSVLENKPQTIHTLHDYSDAMDLKKQLRPGLKTVVIGGGILGLEIADQIINSGGEVIMIERGNRLLSTIMDQAAGSFFNYLLNSTAHLTVLLNTQLQSLSRSNGQTICRTDSPEMPEFTVDTVISAVGIRPENALLPPQWKCNEYLQLQPFENIYAAGDCLQLPGIPNGNYRIARQMGAVAGMNIAGRLQRFAPLPLETRSRFFNTDILCAGQTASGNNIQIKNFTQKDCLERLFYRNNKLIGCILIGDVSNAGRYCRAINSSGE